MTITGRPVPKVVWYRDGVEITKKMMDIINVAGSSTLFVRDADRTHRGLYTVEATNGSGSKKENILVQVQGTHFLLYSTRVQLFTPLCLFIYLLTSISYTSVMQTHLESQWDPSLSATFQRAGALCLGTHQRTMAAPRFHISSLRSARPPRSPGPWYLMNVRSSLSMQPSSLRLTSTSSGFQLLTSLELADLWNQAPSLPSCNTVSGKLENLFI